MKDDGQETLKKEISILKGIGESRASLFRKLGIRTVEDLVTYFPRDYEDRGNLKVIAGLRDGDVCAFEGVIALPVSEKRPRRGLSIQKALVRDGSGSITAVWFNQPFLKNAFKPGEKYVFYGKVLRGRGGFEVQNPVYEKVEGKEMKNTCRIVPVYPSTANLSQNIIRSAVRAALELTAGTFREILPEWVRREYGICGVNYAIESIHFPESDEDFRNARKRLVFEELLLLQLGLLDFRNSLNRDKKGIAFKKSPEISRFIESLPFKLTDAQRRVFAEIERDMESTGIMNRLVQGDVGSGKTMVAVLALFKAVKSGYQGVLMAPTEILAGQHFRSICRMVESFGIRTSLLTGSLPPKRREEVVDDIREGRTEIIIGTHALIEDRVVFNRLGLAVTDEQHRFGVRQRALLSKKGENPDMLVMTATPIPRTLALILYGDLDISIIDELPPGRKPVETYVVGEGMRQRINGFIRKMASEGRQVYIVCPLVEESEAAEAKSALETAERIAKVDFRDLKVGLIYGRMKALEKECVMSSFVKGDIDILVSTTVIEVGVNVPNATVMVVENAERFGLAQLHQLRGRVGRGEHKSYCILYNQSVSDVAGERMKVLEKTCDGFAISEKDLQLRGPGEFFGLRQHGLPDLKIANLYRDLEILKLSQQAAMQILEKDRFLSSDENLALKEKIFSCFRHRLNELSLN